MLILGQGGKKMTQKVQKWVKSTLIIGAALGGACIMSRIVGKAYAGDPPSRFLRFALTLEAQQVPLYKNLAKRAGKHKHNHIAAGMVKAMEAEKQHYYSLEEEAERLGISAWPWYLLGTGVGHLSGLVLGRLPITAALQAVVLIETSAAKDYKKAGQVVQDERLKRLYLEHQVDEESHYSWAREVLSQYW